MLLPILCLLLTVWPFAAVSQDIGGEYIHYRLAMQFKNERKYDQAAEEFRKVLAVYPDHYNSYMQLAEISAAQKNHRLVIYNLQRALVYNPGWGRAQLMLADAFAADGQFDRAIREYQVYQTGADPAVKDSVQILINRLMGRLRGAPAAPAAAPAAQHRPAAQQPASPPAPVRLDPRAEELMKRVVALYGESKYDSTIVAVNAVRAVQSNHPGAYYYAGLVRMNNKQMDMAKINFTRALPHPVYGGAAAFYLGKILGEEGAQTDAVRHLRTSFASSSPGFDREEAAALIEKYGGQRPPQTASAADTVPRNADTVVILEVQSEKYAPIEIRIDEMLSMMTVDTISDAGQKLLAAIRAFQAGRYDEALLEFRRVLAENPNGPVAAQCIYNAAICYYRLRLFKDAENQFQMFLDRFANHRFAPRAEFFKASCFQERGDYSNSERLFRRFIQNHRSHDWVGRAYERLGDSYADMEDHKKASDAYTQALAARNATHTDRVILNYKLGNSAAALGDNNRAITFFSAAIDIGEKNNVFVRVPDSYYKIADIRFRQKQFQQSLDYYKTVTRKYTAFQETPWGLFQIAGIQRNLKQYREAVNTYRELMEKYPDDYWAKQAQWRLEDTIWEHEFRSAQN